MNYEWDNSQAIYNLHKHGRRFSETVAVFEDEMALSREALDAIEEQRFVATPRDYLERILTVIYSYRYETIRLISAATGKEKKAYEQHWLWNDRWIRYEPS